MFPVNVSCVTKTSLAQSPPTHWRESHALAHAPQFAGSFARSMQDAPQRLRPTAHPPDPPALQAYVTVPPVVNLVPPAGHAGSAPGRRPTAATDTPLVPGAPASPFGPGTPASPCGPASPGRPVSPGSPFGPCVPVAPSAPRSARSCQSVDGGWIIEIAAATATYDDPPRNTTSSAKYVSSTFHSPRQFSPFAPCGPCEPISPVSPFGPCAPVAPSPPHPASSCQLL